MNSKDQKKLLDAGFKIIRAEDHHFNPINLRIKYKGDGGHEWKTLEKGFASKAALQKRMTELLKDQMTVQD